MSSLIGISRGFLLASAIVIGIAVAFGTTRSYGGVEDWVEEFPNTNFSRANIDFGEIITDGPRRDHNGAARKAAAVQTKKGPQEMRAFPSSDQVSSWILLPDAN